jgi:hypothetical protein
MERYFLVIYGAILTREMRPTFVDMDTRRHFLAMPEGVVNVSLDLKGEQKGIGRSRHICIH